MCIYYRAGHLFNILTKSNEVHFTLSTGYMSCMFPLQRLPTSCTELVNLTILNKLECIFIPHTIRPELMLVICEKRSETSILKAVFGLNMSP